MATFTQRYPDYLLRTGYAFDEYRLIYAPVPKAGSTAILSALAVAVGLQPDDLARSRKLEATRSLAVHDGSLWGPSFRLAGRSVDELELILESTEWLRVTVVREPARRLWSAWVSKVLVRDPRFVAMFDEPSFPAIPNTPRDVLDSFRAFVEVLPTTSDPDPHWQSQADLAAIGTVDYDHVGRIEELDATEAVVRERVRSAGGTLPAFRRENAGILPFTPDVFGSRALEACAHWTEPDRRAFGYDALTPAAEEPDEVWFRAVEAALPAVRAIIERNARIYDVVQLLEKTGARSP